MNDWFQTFLLHLVESTVWILLFLAIAHLLRIRESRVRCWFYRLSLLKFLFPTVLLASWNAVEMNGEFLSGLTIMAEPVRVAAESTTGHALAAYPLYLWLTGSLAFFILACCATAKVHRDTLKHSAGFTGRYQWLLTTTLRNINRPKDGLRGQLLETGPSIALYGLFRPRIIAKRAFLDTLDDNESPPLFNMKLRIGYAGTTCGGCSPTPWLWFSGSIR